MDFNWLKDASSSSGSSRSNNSSICNCSGAEAAATVVAPLVVVVVGFLGTFTSNTPREIRGANERMSVHESVHYVAMWESSLSMSGSVLVPESVTQYH